MVTAKQRKEILDKLDSYQKVGGPSLDVDEIAKSLAGESDRGMVVIIGSITEDLIVDQIIKKFGPLKPSHVTRMTRVGGVLGNWADIMALAVAFDILNDHDVSLLEVFKFMRNACAHSRRHIDFTTPELKNALSLMLVDEAVEKVRNQTNPAVTRVAFFAVTSYLWGRIKGETPEYSGARVAAMLYEAIDKLKRESSRQKPRRQPSKARRPAPKTKGR